MAYTTVRGGQEAIQEAERLVEQELLAPASGSLTVDQIREQMREAVDQVMGEAGLYDEELAALSLKQAQGNTAEAAFILRAYRSTLPRVGTSVPIDTEGMYVQRRISSAFKEVPGGQVLGRTRDYTQRLLDFRLLHEPAAPAKAPTAVGAAGGATPGQEEQDVGEADSAADYPSFPKILRILRSEGLVVEPPEGGAEEPQDITVSSLSFPTSRSARLQALARGEMGAMVALAYSTMRGFGSVHPAICELRVGWVPIRVIHPLTGRAFGIGCIRMTEVELISTRWREGDEGDGSRGPRFGASYGLVFGQNERKAIAMATLDAALTNGEGKAPAENHEFVLYHIDGIESSGFTEHWKLPHYVTFQSSLDRLRAAIGRRRVEAWGAGLRGGE